MKIKPETSPLNILLADDDIDDRFFFDKALKEIPMASQLITVNNGEQLMEYLTAHSGQLPDILFLDLSMPRKTGFECLSEIKENEKLKGITVIMLTTSFTRGFDLEDNLRKTLIRMGASDYLRKPVEFEELKQIIQQALTNWQLYHLDLPDSPKDYGEILDGIMPIEKGVGLNTGIIGIKPDNNTLI